MTGDDIPDPEDAGPSPLLELTTLWVVLVLLWTPIVGYWMGWLVPALVDALGWLFRPLFLQLGVSAGVAVLGFTEAVETTFGSVGTAPGDGLLVAVLYLAIMVGVAVLAFLFFVVAALLALWYVLGTLKFTHRVWVRTREHAGGL